MNCPSRTDEPLVPEGWNQNPPPLSADLTTREDLNGMANLRTQRNSASHVDEDQVDDTRDMISENLPPGLQETNHSVEVHGKCFGVQAFSHASSVQHGSSSATLDSVPPPEKTALGYLQHVYRVLKKFGKFIGPGFMVSVAYIDPGNYSTDVAAGASTRFKLLFIVLMSNVFAIILQSLAVRLGTVTGLNLAEHCRAHLPRWLNFVLYILGEGAIIATDIAEVSL